jgi:hypothetical protein
MVDAYTYENSMSQATDEVENGGTVRSWLWRIGFN